MLANNSVKYVSVILWVCLQRRAKRSGEKVCNPVIQPALMPLYYVLFFCFYRPELCFYYGLRV